MALYAIGDLHLAIGVKEKSMEIFGPAWENYTQRIEIALQDLTAEDVLILAGDTSWGMTLEETANDFQFLNQFPCEKWLIKGNHDYWWNTAAKMRAFFDKNGFNTLNLIYNNCAIYKNHAICGTRGWFPEDDAQNLKILNREAGRLERSLICAGENAGNGGGNGDKINAGKREILCFLHYPPIYQNYRCDVFIDKMREYGVKKCFYGHLHGQAIQRRFEGVSDGIDYALISADYLKFKPVKICD